MVVNIYLNSNLKVVSIKGDLWGDFNPTLVSVGSSIDYVIPDVATKIRCLIKHDMEDSPFLPKIGQSVRSLGGFRHIIEDAVMDFNLWQLSDLREEGISYLLECDVVHNDSSMSMPSLHLLETADIPSFGILQIDENWNATYISRNFKDLVGCSEKELSNRNWISVVYSEDYELFSSSLYSNTRKNEPSKHNIRILKSNGCVHWVSVHYKKVYDPNRASANIILIFQDIDHQHRDQEQLREMAERDNLTGLGNRYALQQHLERAIRLLHPDGQFCLLYMDLDGFKAVNDGYGHAVGDQLLKIVASRLVDVCAHDDFVARLGGDEFAIIRHKSSASQIDHFAQELLRQVALPYKLVKFAEESYISCSIGVVPVKAEEINYAHTLNAHQVETMVGRLLSQADAAMYDAKSAGKNTYGFYAAHLDEKNRRNLKINNALHRALDRGEFILHYQPQWCLENDQLYGYEALMRWPSFSCDPGQFIPVAENNGLMGHLGRWLIEKAFSDHAELLLSIQQKDWSNGVVIANPTLPKLSINISPIQFRDHKLFDYFEKLLIKYDVPPESVIIEITENLLISKNIEINARLSSLKDLGLSIALDDFGTGYSSLSNLHEFPIDIIKIDKSFVSNISQFETQQIMKAMLQLGKVLNKKVVIEGVETNWQYDFCRSESLAVIQGWLISEALPVKKLKHFILNQEPLWKVQNTTEVDAPLLLANQA